MLIEDVIIIGGGVCGCSLLYELSRYRIKTLLLEKENDVADGTSKANSAIVHAGYDPPPGTMMARYNVEGNTLMEQLCTDLDILYKKTGSLVVGFDETDRKNIEKLYVKGNKNAVPGLRIVEREELFRMEPALNRDIVCALYAPTAAIVAPWEFAIATAECAVKGGAKLEFNAEVTGIKKENGHFVVVTTKGEYRARFVVNAAGVNSDIVSGMAGEKFFTIQPKRGEYYILDTTEANLINMVVFPCPSKLGKGVLVAPTVHGNIIVGPDSTDCPRDATESTAAGLEYVAKNALRSVPSVNLRASIRNFSGVRADAGIEDFIVGESKRTPGFFNIAGIKSPGLSASPAIAKDVAGMLLDKGLDSTPNPDFVATRKVTRFKHLNDDEKKEAIKRNPLYGTIVCRCETVTEGEIVDALNRPLPPRSLDAVKRRCATGMGRCQGGFCGPRVMALIAKHANMSQIDIPLDKEGMYIVTGRTKGKRGL
ncbi:MAG: NAD(P)/FAD-dependent oxidoreductase [Spirochaetaceae bacterium]|jgi:glycerol-3-phosphate dehydrogenase|nr:NAD(P)/FAD-dependent oxidoreductase [Spirochaetaceae bacterium]